MTSNNGKIMPAFSESWMEGIPDKASYNLAVLEARKEFSELSEKEVRELASRLDAAIKSWKLDQGAPIQEIFGSRHTFALTRGSPPQYRKSDMDIILDDKDYPLFGFVGTYRQRIALLIFRAVEKHDSDNVLKAKSVLDLLRTEDEHGKYQQTLMTHGIESIENYRKYSAKKLSDNRHKTDRKAKKLALETFHKMLKNGSVLDIRREDIASVIQEVLTVNGYPKYEWRTIWNDWVKDLDPPGRKAGRKARTSKTNNTNPPQE